MGEEEKGGKKGDKIEEYHKRKVEKERGKEGRKKGEGEQQGRKLNRGQSEAGKITLKKNMERRKRRNEKAARRIR